MDIVNGVEAVDIVNRVETVDTGNRGETVDTGNGGGNCQSDAKKKKKKKKLGQNLLNIPTLCEMGKGSNHPFTDNQH